MPIDIALRNDARVITSDRGNYWRYYGLRCDPFAPGMLSNEIYAVPRWEEYCDLLHYLCHSSNALLVATGIKGSGKTTFMHQFMTQLDEATHQCQLLATPALDIEQITAILVKEFSLAAPHGESLEDQFESLAISFQQCKNPCMLIIDDAHRLSETTLQMLLYLIKQQSEAQMRLHILLLGTPQLNEVFARLTAEEGERELMHHLSLEPLTLEETHRYIKHRLAVAGLPAAVPLSQATINRIHNLSEGILGRINVVARQALIDGMRQPQLHAALDFVRTYQTQFLGGSILLMVLIFMAIMLARGNQVPHFSMHFSLPKFHQASPAPKVEHKVEKAVTEYKPVVAPKKVEPINKPAVMTTPTPAPVMKAVTNNAVIASMQPAFDFSPYQTHIIPVSESSNPPTNAPIKQTKHAEVSARPVNTPNKEPVVEIKKSETTHELVATIVPATTEAAASTVAPAPAPVIAPAKKKAITKTAVHQSQQPIAVPGWLLKANPQHYTIQLIGLSTEQGARDFIADNNLVGHATFVRTHRLTKDWYVLVMGEYATIPEVKAAIQKLPQDLQGYHPWVRKLASVQQAMKQPVKK